MQSVGAAFAWCLSHGTDTVRAVRTPHPHHQTATREPSRVTAPRKRTAAASLLLMFLRIKETSECHVEPNGNAVRWTSMLL
jgi:hypothetical protein